MNQQTFIESLDIRNVTQKRVANNRIHIYFTMNELSFHVFAHCNWGGNRLFYPYSVRHSENDFVPCTLCGRGYRVGGVYTQCSFFDGHYNELFHRLIQMPSIRLEWLYLPHEPFNSPE